MAKERRTIIEVKPELEKEWAYDKNADFTPQNVFAYSKERYWWRCSKGHTWETTPRSRTLGTRGCPYCAGHLPIIGETDFLSQCPEAAKEWDYEKNEGKRPEDYCLQSNLKFWWKCNEGHSWHTSIQNRYKGSKCPYCSGRKVIPGKTDLKSVNPVLAEEWHSYKNGELMPSDVAPNSNKKVWWKCSNNHEWQATIDSRNRGSGCKKCNLLGRKPLMKLIESDFAKEIHPTKNKNVDISLLTLGSGKTIWWKCEKEHEWEARISNRAFNHTGCPYCNNKKVISGETDLKSQYPKLMNEWDFDKNKDINPKQVSPSSKKNVWWKCDKGHEWATPINIRTRGSQCPYCSGRLVIKGVNDLKTLHEDLAKEWHPAKNKPFEVDEIKESSEIKAWWICPKGHEYQSLIYHRVDGLGCPYCAGRYAIQGENDLETKYHDIAKEWHPVKNGSKKPSDVLPNSNKKFWWLCEKGHEWKVSPSDRIQSNSDCPYCVGKLPIPNETDLATVNPELAAEWHPTKNGNKKPSDFLPQSGKKMWWTCSEGHEWRAAIQRRMMGTGCPTCNKNGVYNW